MPNNAADPRASGDAQRRLELAQFLPYRLSVLSNRVSSAIAQTYSAAASFPVPTEQIRWFRAFAGFRFGVITCFNLMLHRRGKRDDPHWEEIALSAPQMFARALDLLG